MMVYVPRFDIYFAYVGCKAPVPGFHAFMQSCRCLEDLDKP
jgi:hypothetical protein